VLTAVLEFEAGASHEVLHRLRHDDLERSRDRPEAGAMCTAMRPTLTSIVLAQRVLGMSTVESFPGWDRTATEAWSTVLDDV